VQNQRILHRLPVIALPGADDPKAPGQVHRPGTRIGLPDFQKDFSPSANLEFAESGFQKCTADTPTAVVGIYGEVEHLTLTRYQPGQEVSLNVSAFGGHEPKAD